MSNYPFPQIGDTVRVIRDTTPPGDCWPHESHIGAVGVVAKASTSAWPQVCVIVTGTSSMKSRRAAASLTTHPGHWWFVQDLEIIKRGAQ